MIRYNRYNLNPPEPIIDISNIVTPTEIFEEMVEEHLYEEYYEKNNQFIDTEELRIRELIKNGESDQTIPRQLSWHSVP